MVAVGFRRADFGLYEGGLKQPGVGRIAILGFMAIQRRDPGPGISFDDARYVALVFEGLAGEPRFSGMELDSLAVPFQTDSGQFTFRHVISP